MIIEEILIAINEVTETDTRDYTIIGRSTKDDVVARNRVSKRCHRERDTNPRDVLENYLEYRVALR